MYFQNKQQLQICVFLFSLM